MQPVNEAKRSAGEVEQREDNVWTHRPQVRDRKICVGGKNAVP